MILAEDEIGLGDDHAGDHGSRRRSEPGTPLVDVLPIRDQVLDVTPTVNRVDLLSMVGVAREIAALVGGDFHPPEPDDPSVVDAEEVEIAIEDFVGCPRYIGRVFRDVAIGPSPQWLRSRLFLAEMRSISNVVDVTNYVMHVWGSPLHAFDRTKLAGGRIVVRARAPARSCARSTGLCGGSRPTISSSRTARRRWHWPRSWAVPTARSPRHDRDAPRSGELRAAGDPALVGATCVAHRRVESLGEGGRPVPRRERVRSGQPDARRSRRCANDGSCRCACRAPRASGRSPAPGAGVARDRGRRAPDEQRSTLRGFGFDVSDDWKVTVPTWRARDVTREADLIEEVARPLLDRLPLTMPLRRHVRGRLTKEQRLRRAVEDTLVGAGLSEAYTWSLVATDPSADAIRLPSPMTSDQAILRTTIVPGLVEAARTGVDAGADEVALFEIARVYLLPASSCPTSTGVSPESSRAATKS